jgi:competence protein ComEA
LPAPDSIVKDAIVAAGGASDDADLDRINLALAVADGQHVYVPRLGEQQLAVEPPGNPSTSGGKININTANAAELEVLPAIGPSIAQRICDYRDAHGPFGRIEDIMEVSHWPGHVCQDTRPDYD